MAKANSFVKDRAATARGFTIIELMIALVLAAVVTSAALGTGAFTSDLRNRLRTLYAQ